jgi:hypothetical protein
MRALLVTALVLASAPAHADDTFEAKAGGAQRVHRLENVVWALTAPCDKGDDTDRRQCRIVRDARVAELQKTALLVDADADAFDAGAWSAAKKSSPLVLSGCIRCAGVDVDGKTYYLTAAGTNPRFEGGKLKTDALYDNARAFGDEASAKTWSATLANAHVELVVKLGAKSKWTADGKTGFAFDVLAYRVVAPCDGSVVIAKPASGPGETDKKQCVKPAAPAETPAAPAEKPKLEALTPSTIQSAMQPVVTSAQACYEHFGVTGRAKLRFTVLGDGSVAKYEQQGDFVGTPTGECIDQAVKAVAFPRTQKAKNSFSYPIPLP